MRTNFLLLNKSKPISREMVATEELQEDHITYVKILEMNRI